MTTLYLIRGLPSAGKTTLGSQLGVPVFEADDYFICDGEYKFDPSKLQQAHADCLRRTEACIFGGKSCAVANTFTQRWEMQPYIDLALSMGITLTVIDLFDGGQSDKVLADRNKHDVPLEAFGKMRKRYEHDWGRGNPDPPWKRS